MLRTALALAVLAACCLAHGGVFRPPPRLKPGDIFMPKIGQPTSTRSEARVRTLSPWEYWWRLNRGPILRLRGRILERTTTSGTLKTTGGGGASDLFDRASLREQVLTPVMIEALRDRDQAVRTAAAVALGKFRATRAAPLLHRLYRRDNIREVREAALIGLMLMRDPEQKEFFRKVAARHEETARVRGIAILGLGFLGDKDLLLDIMRQERDGRLRGSSSAVDQLRACATLALGWAGSVDVVPALLEAAQDEDSPRGVAGYAGSALARLGYSIAVPELMKILEGRKKFRDEARYGAALAVGALVKSDEHAIIDLCGKKAQRDKDIGVRALLLLSLGHIGGDRAATHIVAGMAKAGPRLRSFHYLALGLSRFDDAGTLLEAAYKQAKNPSDRAAIALAFAFCGHKGGAPLLREQLEKGQRCVVPHVMVALGLLDDSLSIPLVQETIGRIKDPVVRSDGVIALALLRRSAAIPELLELMKKGKSTLSRGAVAAAIGLVGTERCVKPLLDVYRNKKRKDEERALALASLGRIADAESIALLQRFSQDINPYVICDAVTELLDIL